MERLVRNFWLAERMKGWGFAFRALWVNLWHLLLGGYSCFYCKVGAVRRIPTRCPLCHKYLSLRITKDTTIEDLVEAGMRNGVRWHVSLAEYRLAE